MAAGDKTLPRITNRQARRLLLAAQGLMEHPGRKLDQPGLLALIEQMGFVQVDSINTVERAHHQILFSRNQTYRQKQLTRLLERDRALFENWTHDASIIPSAFYPFWQRRFARESDALAARWRKWRREGFEDYLEHVLQRVTDEGPLMARDFGEEGSKPKGGWWDWHPEKTALEYLWRTGQLAVARREGFQKVYDLPERVVPPEHLQPPPDPAAFTDWKCRSALQRLHFGTSGEIAAFWGALAADEAARWCKKALAKGELVQVEVEGTDGGKPRVCLAFPDLLDSLDGLADPPARLRVLSPFDPLIRDRQRLERVFGFTYRIEVFVPEAKRQYGYYVFPMLEGERMVGRIDMKHDRATGTLGVKAVWWEAGIKPSKGRVGALEAELERQRRFTKAERVNFDDGWQR